jgi:hypothetical protein
MPPAFSNGWRIMAELLHGISSSTAGIIQEFRHTPIFSNGWRIYSRVLAEFGGIISVEAWLKTEEFHHNSLIHPHESAKPIKTYLALMAELSCQKPNSLLYSGY